LRGVIGRSIVGDINLHMFFHTKVLDLRHYRMDTAS